MNKLVSIITPLFNAEKYIEETYESILNQTYENWEWIVVDDGSSDNSVPIIKAICEKNSRVKFFTRTRLPKNASTCRNIGIEEAKGGYVLFVDSDDIIGDTCLEIRMKFTEENLDLDFSIFLSASFNTVNDSMNVVKEKVVKNDLSDLENFLLFNYPWCIMGPFWKMETLEKLNGFDESFNRLQDPELHIRAIIGDLKYKKVNVLDTFYRLTFKGIAFPDKKKTQKIYVGYLSYINKILIPNSKKLSKNPFRDYIKFSFSGTIRNYLLHYKFYDEVYELSNLMQLNGFISKQNFNMIKRTIRLNKLGFNHRYINKLMLYSLERNVLSADVLS